MKAQLQENKIRRINAEGKIFGRLASEVAFVLQGKDKSVYKPNAISGDIVEIENIDRVRMEQKKQRQKLYYRHSGYPGGLKSVTFEALFEKRPKEVFRKAVWGMLPKNKLRDKLIKRLHFVEGSKIGRA